MDYRRKLCRNADNVSTRVLIGVEPIPHTNKFTIRFRGTERDGMGHGRMSVAFPADYSFGFSTEADAIQMAERIIAAQQSKGYRICPDAPDEEFPCW